MKKFSNIEFYFPNNLKSLTKNGIAKNIVEMIKKNGSLQYCGFTDEKTALKNISINLGDGVIESYKSISDVEKNKIQQIIEDTLRKCNQLLKIPTKQFIFVLPYFPNKDQEVFGGTYGYAVYSCVFYLFIDLNSFSRKSLENTVAHELNHTIYFYNHYNNFGNYSLIDNIVMEGLAENFRKKVLGGVLPPWTKSLNKKEVISILSSNVDILNNKNTRVISDFIFGSKKFKKWTGYSCGFHLVQKFIEHNPKQKWGKIMKTKSEDFLKIIL